MFSSPLKVNDTSSITTMFDPYTKQELCSLNPCANLIEHCDNRALVFAADSFSRSFAYTMLRRSLLYVEFVIIFKLLRDEVDNEP